jgi:hypothetical protein
LFDNSLAKFDKDMSDRWENVTTFLLVKTLVEVRRHEEHLIEDGTLIEADWVAFPIYIENSYTPDEWMSDQSGDLKNNRQFL